MLEPVSREDSILVDGIELVAFKLGVQERLVERKFGHPEHLARVFTNLNLKLLTQGQTPPPSIEFLADLL
jgi:hypothetical protein